MPADRQSGVTGGCGGFYRGNRSLMSGFDELRSKHQEDFARLRRSFRRSSLKPLALAFLAVLLFFSLSPQKLSREEFAEFGALRQEVAAIEAPWGRRLVETHLAERHWLTRHGTAAEVRALDAVGSLLFRTALSLAGGKPAEGRLIRIYGTLHLGILRALFIVIACWRVWAVAILLAVLYGFLSVRDYRGDDLLGCTGNGRLFYSGIRAALEDVDETGAPDVHVPGLACLPACSASAARTSKLWAVLEEAGAATDTNQALTAIIVRHANWPAYLAPQGEEELLKQCYAGCGLEENAALLLSKALSLHAECVEAAKGKSENDVSPDGKFELTGWGTLEGDEPKLLSDGPGANLPLAIEQPDAVLQAPLLTAEQYADRVTHAFRRSLTTAMALEIGKIDPCEVATAVLSLEAAKAMTYDRLGNGWAVVSNFPQLCARAVLHSCPAFALEYPMPSRNMIRRALIYGLRRSIFGPVRFAVDLSPAARALRQWVEILLATPHQLGHVTDDVQLFGISSEVHDRWKNLFLKSIHTGDKRVIDGIIATEANVLFVPLKTVLSMFKRVCDKETSAVLQRVVEKVSERQKGRQASQASGDDEYVSLPDYERIPAPFSEEEIRELSELHGLSAARLQEWSYVRIVLYSYGWLARRVGDSTVPESYLVFSAVKVEAEVEGQNELGIRGSQSMVALRATKLIEQWGSQWQSRFVQGRNAAIASTREDFEKLLQGIAEPEEAAETGAVV